MYAVIFSLVLQNTRTMIQNLVFMLVDDVYETDSDDEPLSFLCRQKSHENLQSFDIISSNRTEHCTNYEQQATTSGRKVLSSGDFVLVKLLHKKTEKTLRLMIIM